jgi:N-methylhydantoinase B
VGGKRLIAMMDEFGLEHLDDLAKHILDHSREASLAAINKLPHGTYHNSMMVDGINGKSMENKATVTNGPDGIAGVADDVRAAWCRPRRRASSTAWR